MTNDYAVVLCADEKYFAPGYAVCLQLAQNRSANYDIYLLTEPGPHLDRLPHDLPFRVLTPSFDRLPNIPALYRHVPRFSYLRLFISDILKDCRRALYLDCDVRVAGTVDRLFTLDMQGAPIAAVDAPGTYIPTVAKPMVQQTEQANMGRSGFDPTAPYFNAGALLIDCERWRQDRLLDDCLDVIRRYDASSIPCGDQDILNIITYKRWAPLSPRWNFESTFFQSTIEQILNPVVFHYVFAKPWNFGEGTARERTYFRAALGKTPYADFMGPPSLHEIKHIMVLRAKMAMQYATFFIPSSYQRIRNRNGKRIQKAFARYLIENVRTRRFIDVDQGISRIDVEALTALL